MKYKDDCVPVVLPNVPNAQFLHMPSLFSKKKTQIHTAYQT